MDDRHSVGFNPAWQAEKTAKLAKIDELRREYISSYTRREAMLTNERGDIYCRYVRLLGKAKYLNFKLSVETRVLKMKVELAQAALNHNRRPDLEEIDRVARSKLERYYAELNARSMAIKAAENAVGISRFAVDELKELYRMLVRRLHPDLHPDLPDGLKDLFVKGQAAYRTYDLDMLRDIVKRLDMDDFGSVVCDVSLDDTIARLARDVDQINRDICNLRNSFPFDIESDLLDPVWVEAQQKALEVERFGLEQQKAMYAERLDLLTS